jgi:hypothetical protein
MGRSPAGRALRYNSSPPMVGCGVSTAIPNVALRVIELGKGWRGLAVNDASIGNTGKQGARAAPKKVRSGGTPKWLLK